MQIGFTFDLRDDYRKLGYSEEAIAECDNNDTIDSIASTLQSLGHKIERIGNIWKLTEALSAGKRWDLVFNVCEGIHGISREAQVPALLEAYQIPYTFSSPEVIVACHDKSLAKLIVQQAGIATARYHVVRSVDDLKKINLPYPLFAKPLAEGTGKGITAQSVINSPEQLNIVACELLGKYNQPVLVETYLSGREFTVGVVGNGVDARVVGVMEITMKEGAEAGGHTYHNKENCEEVMEYSAAQDSVAKAAGQLALSAWAAIGCRDGGRIDIRCDENNVPHFLEVNPLAGLHPTHSDLPILANQAGISYKELLGNILNAAIKRLDLDSIQKNIKCAS